MKKRVIYSLLFGIPGFLISGILSLIIFGLAMGILWILVFGDNPWPSSIERALPALMILPFLILWIASIAAGFFVGKKLEQDPSFNRKHLLASAGVAFFSILLVVLFLLSNGSIGSILDGQRCSDFCRQNEYSASSMSPGNSGERTCSCLDQNGEEALRSPVEKLNVIK